MRSFALMHQDGIPVIYDVTHFSSPGRRRRGDRRRPAFRARFAHAAVAAGADGLFLEVHPILAHALPDRATQLDLAQAEKLLGSLLALPRTSRLAREPRTTDLRGGGPRGSRD